MDINEHAPTRLFSRPLILLAADANLLFFSTLCSDISLLLMYAKTIQHCLRMFTRITYKRESHFSLPKKDVSIPLVIWPYYRHTGWGYMHSAISFLEGCRCFNKSSTSGSVWCCVWWSHLTVTHTPYTSYCLVQHNRPYNLYSCTASIVLQLSPDTSQWLSDQMVPVSVTVFR